MKVLFVAPYVPNRIRVRPFQLIRTLVNRGHDVTVLAVCSSPQEKKDADELLDMGAHVSTAYLPTWRSANNCLRALFGRQPLQASYSWHSDLADELDRLVAHDDFDVVHIEHLRGSQYGLHLNALQTQPNGHAQDTLFGQAPGSRIPIVWDSVDCISHLFEQASQESRSLKGRLMTRLELNRTRSYEGWLVHQFDRVLVTSPADKAALIQLASETTLAVVPGNGTCTDDAPSRQEELDRRVNVLRNGVDLDYFSTGNEARTAAQIVFSGKMSYHANITAALHLVHDVMPHVWAQRPDAEVWIVGKDPSPEVRALATTDIEQAGQQASQRTGEQNRVYVTGTTPDLRPYLREATLAVAPMPYGAGIQNKVLEAMACGAPVVASTQAVSALSAVPDRDLLVAEDAEEFAEAILQLLAQPERRERIGQAGRAYVERFHSWDEVGARLEDIYASAASPVEATV